MDMSAIGTIAGSAVLILGGLAKISRQTGRIEQEVMGLHDRVKRLENWVDRRQP
ncbi:MAG: hypothetical protein ACYCV4_02435 [Dermatophilaceae bacterium]